MRGRLSQRAGAADFVAVPKATVRVTANFEANLDAIQVFLSPDGVDDATLHAYHRLLDDLTDTVVPNLAQHPTIGRPFLARDALSVEARTRIAKLRKRASTRDLREYVAGDYLILYAVIEQTVYLLSIKHHRQLSFDFDRFWPAG
jgi:ParE toxin of type II toxin-antitoxin system, parDE